MVSAVFKRALDASVRLTIEELNALAPQVLAKMLSKEDQGRKQGGDARIMAVEDEVEKVSREP